MGLRTVLLQMKTVNFFKVLVTITFNPTTVANTETKKYSGYNVICT